MERELEKLGSEFHLYLLLKIISEYPQVKYQIKEILKELKNEKF